MSLRVVADAWADIADWVHNELAGLATRQKLPDQSREADGVDACRALNSPGPKAAIWSCDGRADVTLTDLQITQMTGLELKPAVFHDSVTLHLPIAFSQLEITGAYRCRQPCGLYELGSRIDTGTAEDRGTVTERFYDSSLYYIAGFSDHLVIGPVVLANNPGVTLRPDTGNVPAWFSALTDFFSAAHQAAGLREEIQRGLTAAPFSTTMTNLLNEKITGRH